MDDSIEASLHFPARLNPAPQFVCVYRLQSGRLGAVRTGQERSLPDWALLPTPTRPLHSQKGLIRAHLSPDPEIVQSLRLLVVLTGYRFHNAGDLLLEVVLNGSEAWNQQLRVPLLEHINGTYQCCVVSDHFASGPDSMSRLGGGGFYCDLEAALTNTCWHEIRGLL